MKSILFVIIAGLLSLNAQPAYSDTLSATGTVEVHFSPNGGATSAIVNEIQSAKKEILIQAYTFTSTPIAEALLDAHRRSVKVTVLLDKSQRKERYTSATFLFNAGIQVMIDDKHAIAHNKIMIIDRETLITGSFNFTRGAEEKNAENLLILKSNKMLVERYISNFEEHKGHSQAYR